MEIVFSNVNEVKKYLGDSEYKKFCLSAFDFSEEAIEEYFTSEYPVYDMKSSKKEQNKTTYSEIVNLSPNTYGKYIENTSIDFLSDHYEDVINDFMKTDDTVDILKSNFPDMTETFISDVINDKTFIDRFNKVKEHYVNENDNKPFFNNSDDIDDDGFLMEGIDEEDDGYVDTFQELLDIDDKIGEVTYVENGGNIDWNTREFAFIYIDGNIITGEEQETHSDLLRNYLEEIGETDNIPKDMLNGDKQYSRPSKQRLQRLTNSEDVAFGHVMDSMAFIETLFGNVKAKTVAEACMDELNIEKAYQYDQSQLLVKRLAKKFRQKLIRIM